MASLDPDKAPQFLDTMLKQNNIVLISATYCNFCVRVKSLLIEHNARFVSLEIDIIPNGRELFRAVVARTANNTVPQVFVRGKFIGGYDDMAHIRDSGRLRALIDGDG
eukprot:PhF_6_TR41544/c0_g1_i1/m.62930/K03676/grxC, GLRX, GLRX2; glutaredoxin 3